MYHTYFNLETDLGTRAEPLIYPALARRRPFSYLILKNIHALLTPIPSKLPNRSAGWTTWVRSPPRSHTYIQHKLTDLGDARWHDMSHLHLDHMCVVDACARAENNTLKGKDIAWTILQKYHINVYCKDGHNHKGRSVYQANRVHNNNI